MNMGMGNNFMNWNPTNNPAAVAAAAGAPTNMPFGLNLFGVGKGMNMATGGGGSTSGGGVGMMNMGTHQTQNFFASSSPSPPASFWDFSSTCVSPLGMNDRNMQGAKTA